ncbi:MAG: glycosyltransferase family 9 protein [bacterium]|nr:glycosyltransferase family 9 protein [bacterium]
MSVTRRAKQSLMRPLARALRRERLEPGALTALRPARILVVRQHNQMGDMVCATPALRAIAETWPDAAVALVTSPANAGVVRHNPHLSRVLVFEKPLRRLPPFLGELRRWDADLAIVLSSVSFSLTSALIGLLSGARHVVGADSRAFGWEFGEHCFSLVMPGSPVVDRHAIVHGLAPLRAVGVTTDDESTVVVPSAAERQDAAAITAALGLEAGYWALHPGAGKRQNVWPASRFAAVARRAAGEGRQVLVLHGPADSEALAAFGPLRVPGVRHGALVVAPPCGVGVAAALLAGADRFLCNDTGIMHVAGAMRVPTLALFGPTDPGLWKPPAPEVLALRAGHRVEDPRGDEYGWMEAIDEDTVWRAWSGLTGRSAANRDG